MTKNTIIGIGIAAAILILVIVWLVVGRGGGYRQVSLTPTPYISPAVTPIATTTPAATESATPSATQNLVTLTTSGFSPKTLEITQGGTVTWVNNDTATHQVASTPHPTHTDYPPLNSVGSLQPGQSKSLKFDTVGTYRYHNHLNPGTQGTVVVK